MPELNPDMFQLLQGLSLIPQAQLPPPGMDMILAALLGGTPGVPPATPETRLQTVPGAPPRPPVGPAEAGQNFGQFQTQPSGLSPFGV